MKGVPLDSADGMPSAMMMVTYFGNNEKSLPTTRFVIVIEAVFAIVLSCLT